MAYSEILLDHFRNPRNVGELKDANGIGEVGNEACGDVMKLYIKVNDETGIIEDAKFETFGCASAIASSSISTEMIKGKKIDEALELSNKAIVEALGGLPKNKIHCSVLAVDALERAIADYKGEEIKAAPDPVICHCMGIKKSEILHAIEHGLDTVEKVAEATGATTGGCGGERCKAPIEEMIKDYYGEVE
jgi:NifU-like protein